jgi:hypothetical protein
MMFEDEGASAKKKLDSREVELYSISVVMKTENGRCFMWRCLQNCYTFETVFNTDAHLHAFNSGKRSHGLWLDEEIREAAPDDYFKMLKENG